MYYAGYYTSPILLFLLYRKGYFVYDGAVSIAKISVCFGSVLFLSYCIRSWGRISNAKYLEFHKALTDAQKNLNSSTKVSNLLGL